MKNCLYLFFLVPFFANAQIVKEVIQVDTARQTIKVIYKPTDKTTYYHKKVAVFADDTTQVAIEKSYTNYGQNGSYKVYYPSGKLRIKTVFANNKIHGEWILFDENGAILIKGIYQNGVKFGYWAYKALKIYGRYKKGYKHKKWKRFDESERKYFSHYRKGKLIAGEGYGDEVPFYLEQSKKKEVRSEVDTVLTNKDSVLNQSIDREYQQAISFLTSNVMFRKALKKHFGTSMKKSLAVKKLYKNQDQFQYSISPEIVALDISKFIEESKTGKIVVASIDAILKNKEVELKQFFSGEMIGKDIPLHNKSTDKESSAVVTFSAVKMDLLRLNVNWNFKDEKHIFRILLYFEGSTLKGAEYEKQE